MRRFAASLLDDEQIIENDPFDLGIAVAIEGDRLATAVITHANTRGPGRISCSATRETVEETRTGRVDAMNAPVLISSLGAFGVRSATPIVVPHISRNYFSSGRRIKMKARKSSRSHSRSITAS